MFVLTTWQQQKQTEATSEDTVMPKAEETVPTETSDDNNDEEGLSR